VTRERFHKYIINDKLRKGQNENEINEDRVSTLHLAQWNIYLRLVASCLIDLSRGLMNYKHLFGY